MPVPALPKVYLFLAGACLCFVGCRKEEISTFSVPKSSNEVIASKTPAPSSAQIRWTVPAGWVEQPAGGMRAGSFLVTKGEQQADVSIIPLGGISGSELDNVNRWRGQVGLEPVDQAGLTAAAEKVSIGSAQGSLYDMAGSDPKAKQPARILASILSAGGTTWFFKMVGPDALVAEQKPAFKELLQSIRFEAGAAEPPMPDGHAPTGTLPDGHPPIGGLPDGHPPVPMGPQDAATVPSPENTADKPVWDVPGGWEEQPPSSMRVATFAITGTDGAKADVSVIKLGGSAGGTLENVNRWRAQVGLAPVDEAELAKLLTTQEIGGVEITFVDMPGRGVESGDPARLLAAMAPHAGSTWFYKMLGDDQLVAQQKAAFVKFVETARYPNAL